jgi:hypothetical protein
LSIKLLLIIAKVSTNCENFPDTASSSWCSKKCDNSKQAEESIGHFKYVPLKVKVKGLVHYGSISRKKQIFQKEYKYDKEGRLGLHYLLKQHLLNKFKKCT